MSDDIARNTSSESARIATIPGSNTVGIELPNSIRENVYLNEILVNADFKKKEIKLPIALGKSISGRPIIGDLSSMPHLLIAGTTGSGKVDLGVLQGRPRSEVSKMQLFMDVMKSLEGEHKTPVEEKQLVEELAKTEKFTEEEAKNFIRKMARDSSIYESKPGHYNIV